MLYPRTQLAAKACHIRRHRATPPWIASDELWSSEAKKRWYRRRWKNDHSCPHCYEFHHFRIYYTARGCTGFSFPGCLCDEGIARKQAMTSPCIGPLQLQPLMFIQHCPVCSCRLGSGNISTNYKHIVECLRDSGTYLEYFIPQSGSIFIPQQLGINHHAESHARR